MKTNLCLAVIFVFLSFSSVAQVKKTKSKVTTPAPATSKSINISDGQNKKSDHKTLNQAGTSKLKSPISKNNTQKKDNLDKSSSSSNQNIQQNKEPDHTTKSTVVSPESIDDRTKERKSTYYSPEPDPLITPKTNPSYTTEEKKQHEFNDALAHAKMQNNFNQMFDYFNQAINLCRNYHFPDCANRIERTKKYKFDEAIYKAKSYSRENQLEALLEIKKWFCKNPNSYYCKALDREIESISLWAMEQLFEKKMKIAESFHASWQNRINAIIEAHELSNKIDAHDAKWRVESLIKDMFASAIDLKENWDSASELCDRFPGILYNCQRRLDYKKYNEYILSAKREDSFEKKKRALLNAQNICLNRLSNTSCQEDINQLMIAAHEQQFEKILSALNKLNDYEKQNNKLNELKHIADGIYGNKTLKQKYIAALKKVSTKEFNRLKKAIFASNSYKEQLNLLKVASDIGVQKGALSSGQLQELEGVERHIHLREIERLLYPRNSYSKSLQSINWAKGIMNDHQLYDLIGDKITQAYQRAHIREIQRILFEADDSDFEFALRSTKEAEELIPLLLGEKRAVFLSQIDNKRASIVQKEYFERKNRSLLFQGTWEKVLQTFDELMVFAQQYVQYIPSSEKNKLQEHKNRYLQGQFEKFIKEVKTYIDLNALWAAYYALVKAKELADSGNLSLSSQLNASGQLRRHTEKLYATSKKVFEINQKSKNWKAARTSLNVISELESSFNYNGTVSAKDLSDLLELDYFEYLLIEAEINVDSPSKQKNAYIYLVIAVKAILEEPENYQDIQIKKLDFLIDYISNRTLTSELKLRTIENYARIGLELQRLDSLLIMRKESPAFRPGKIDSIKTFATQFFNQHIENIFQKYDNSDSTDANIKTINTIEYQISIHSLLDIKQFTEKLSQASHHTLTQESQAIKELILTEEENLTPYANRIDSMTKDYGKFLDTIIIDQHINELDFVLTFQEGKNAYKKQQYHGSLQFFNKARQKTEKASIQDSLLLVNLQKEERLSLLAYLDAEIARVNMILNEATKAEETKKLIRFRQNYPDIELSPTVNSDLKVLGKTLIAHQCEQLLIERNAIIKKAESRAKHQQYVEAVQLYSIADTIGRAFTLCNFDNQQIKNELKSLRPAANFIIRNKTITRYFLKEDYQSLDTAYQSLWKYYNSERINERFGLEFESFGNYVLATKEDGLQKYFVVKYADRPSYLKDVSKVFQKMINGADAYSTGALIQMAEEMAVVVYAAKPDKNWNNGFKYFKFKPESDAKDNYKAFVKSWKVAWKRCHKNAG